MSVHRSEARWEGVLQQGKGVMKIGRAGINMPYSFTSRFKDGDGASPEELIGAAHAGCFSMALSASLERAGFTPDEITTKAAVRLEQNSQGSFQITNIELNTEAKIPDITDDEFQEIATNAKENCPVSMVLKGGTATIELKAKLLHPETTGM
jgi:osmotically inducible protein OsmC